MKKKLLTGLLAATLFGTLCTSVEAGIFDIFKKNKKSKKEEVVDPNEKVTITLASGSVGIELDLNKRAADMYMKEHPNVDIQIWDLPDSASDRLGLYMQFLEARSDKLDIYQIDVIWPGDMAEHLLDLNEFGAKDVADNYFQPIIQNNTVDGKLVAIPWHTDAGMLYYRSDLLEKYNLKAPKTWEELEKSAKIIQDGERAAGNQDFWGYVWQGNAYEGLTCDALEWLDSNGAGTIVSSEKEVTVYNPKAVEALNRAKNWIGTISPNGVISMMEEDSRAVWQSGNAAFMRNWPYAYALGNAENSVIKGKFNVMPVPKVKGGKNAAALGGWQLAVSKYSAHPEIAADVAMFMSSEKVQKMRAIEGSLNPTIKSLYQDKDVLEASPFFGSLYDVFISATPRPSTATAPNYAQVSQKFYQAVYSVLNGQVSAEDALEDLSYDIEEITGYPVAK